MPTGRRIAPALGTKALVTNATEAGRIPLNFKLTSIKQYTTGQGWQWNQMRLAKSKEQAGAELCQAQFQLY